MELQDITKKAVVVSENATFEEALHRMVSEQTNSLLVVNAEGLFVGEVGVSDLLDAVVPEYLDGDQIATHFADEKFFKKSVVDVKNRPVSEFMSVEPISVETTDGLMAVASAAIASGQARIPIVDHEHRPVGVISRRGLKHLLAKYLGIKDKEK